jgi:hypothetical protein
MQVPHAPLQAEIIGVIIRLHAEQQAATALVAGQAGVREKQQRAQHEGLLHQESFGY